MPISNQSAKRGVIYCGVSQRDYVEAALISAIALRQIEPDIPITFLTDYQKIESLQLEQFNITTKTLLIPEVWKQPQAMESRLVKTSLPSFTDYEQTLYLDADILPLQPITPIWEYLEQGNIGLCLERTPTISRCNHIAPEEKEYTLQKYPGDSLHFNAGMILWQTCPQTSNLFKAWKQEWMRFKQHDQLALTRAIHATQTPVTAVSSFYNFPFPKITAEVINQKQIRLLHCVGGMVQRGYFREVASHLAPVATTIACKLLR